MPQVDEDLIFRQPRALAPVRIDDAEFARPDRAWHAHEPARGPSRELGSSEKSVEIPSATRAMCVATERLILGPARGPDFDFARFEAARAAFEAART
jgi:hypothetical protein